jgi:hypothetical protein
MPTFAEYLEKWLKQSTAQGLTNPLVKMPVKRFRRLQQSEFDSLANVPTHPHPEGGTSPGGCLEESRLLREGQFLTFYVIGVSWYQWFLKNLHRSPVA